MDQSFSRTQIYLEAHQSRALAKVAKQRGATQSAIIREAVDAYLREQKHDSRLEKLRSLAGAMGADAYDGFDLRAIRAKERVF